MNRITARCRDTARHAPKRDLRPSLEGLEDRKLLYSTVGGHWYYPDRITYSFVPDGTNVGWGTSNLFQKLNQIAPTATWEGVFEEAAAIWQQVAGINLALVSDDGSPVGIAGDQQDDPRFGDIRIGGTSLSGALAETLLPPPIIGGTDAGDIIFNTNEPWHINNDYDLLTVAIHEFGHALGMGHSDIQSADMYAYYNGMKQSLTADDIAGIQSLYGPVPNDPTHNTTFDSAIDLSVLIDGNSQVAYNAGYVTNYSDWEWYKVTVPSSTTGNMVVSMQSSNLSSLSPRLAIENSAGVILGQSMAVNVYGATVSYTINGVSPGEVYYIRCSAAQNGPGADGAFGILINFGSQYQAPIAPPNTVVAQHGDLNPYGYMSETNPSPNDWTGHRRHRHHGSGSDIAQAPDGDTATVNINGHQVPADAMLIGQPFPGSSGYRHKHHHH